MALSHASGSTSGHRPGVAEQSPFVTDDAPGIGLPTILAEPAVAPDFSNLASRRSPRFVCPGTEYSARIVRRPRLAARAAACRRRPCPSPRESGHALALRRGGPLPLRSRECDSLGAGHLGPAPTLVELWLRTYVCVSRGRLSTRVGPIRTRHAMWAGPTCKLTVAAARDAFAGWYGAGRLSNRRAHAPPAHLASGGHRSPRPRKPPQRAWRR